MTDSFAELVGTSSGSHLQQSGDPADDMGTGLQQPMLSAPSASDLRILELGQNWLEPVETSDKMTRSDVPLSKSEYNRLLFEARMSSMGDAEMKLP